MQQGWGWEINDSLNLEGVKENFVFGDNESQKMTRINAQDTLVRIKPDIVTSAAEEKLAEVFRMVFALS